MLRDTAIFLCGFFIGVSLTQHAYADPFPTPRPAPQIIVVEPRPMFPTFNGTIVRRPMNCDATPMYPYCDCAAPGTQCVPR